MKKIEKAAYATALLTIVGLPLQKFLYYCIQLLGGSYTAILDQSYFLWLLIPISLIIYIFGIMQKEFKITYVDILIYILAILGVISTIFAVDVGISIVGENGRYEGLLSLISYYLLFLNVKNIKREDYKKNIIKVFICVGVFQVIYSILQVYTAFPIVIRYKAVYMGMGLCGNPNFFGSYMTMLVFFTLSLYLLKGEIKYLFLTLLFFCGLCLANSTGPFIGFLVSFIFFVIVYFKKIDIRRLVIIILALVALFFLVDKLVYNLHTVVYQNKIKYNYNIIQELSNISVTIEENTFGNGRFTIWKNSIPLIKEYFWFGSGLDTFKLIYPHHYLHIFDKAHNVYLQMLITNGIFALITYCALCLNIFIRGFKFKEYFQIALFMAFVGYSVQAFANISVIDVAPIFFIILGLLHTYIPDNFNNKKNKDKIKNKN